MDANVFRQLCFALLQPRCFCCGQRSDTPVHCLCTACVALCANHQPCCPSCGLVSQQGQCCGDCQAHPKPYQQMHCLGWYQGTLRQLIQAFKYQRQVLLGNALAQAWLQQCQPERPDLILPVPTPRGKLAHRGFNPATELASYLAQQLQLPLRTDLCYHSGHSQAQVKQNRKQRYRQARQAYRVEPCPFGHIALVDDVVTTQATVMALATQLRAKGASRVDIWAMARTP